MTVGELILGHYRTCIEPDELLVEVRVPPQPGRATYRKFRSRSAEDRPCVAVAAARGEDGLRVVVGAVAGTPQDFPDLCDGEPAEVAAAYAERIAPMSDARGSAEYRRRVIAAEVRRAVEEVVVDPRVTGAQRYSCHAERPGMLHAAFVRSPYPHARVLSVTGPDDVVVLTPDDVADLNPYGCQVKDQRVLADVARHIGDVVAAVAAPTRAEARAAAQRVEVEYEELPAVFDPLEALDAPPIHEQSVSAGEAVSIEVRPIEGTNVCHRFRIRHGDVAQGFAQADVVVEETYRVAGAAHAPMEPHAAVAEWEDGRLTLWSGTQTPFNVRSDLAGCFGLPEDAIRVIAPAMGGSFGAKTFVRLEALVAALARKAERAGQGGARPRRGVRHAQPPPGGGARSGSAPAATAR